MLSSRTGLGLVVPRGHFYVLGHGLEEKVLALALVLKVQSLALVLDLMVKVLATPVPVPWHKGGKNASLRLTRRTPEHVPRIIRPLNHFQVIYGTVPETTLAWPWVNHSQKSSLSIGTQ